MTSPDYSGRPSDKIRYCARCSVLLREDRVVTTSLFDHFSPLCEGCAKDENHYRNEHGFVPDLRNLIVDGIVYPNPRKRNDI